MRFEFHNISNRHTSVNPYFHTWLLKLSAHLSISWMRQQGVVRYKRQLTAIVRQYYNTAWCVTGPLVQRVESLGELLRLVVEAFGEVSEDLERTITAIAESRALFLSRETGQPVSEARAGWIFGQYRRLLTRLFISSLTSCLLARMGHFEGGGKDWEEENLHLQIFCNQHYVLATLFLVYVVNNFCLFN